MRHLVSAALLTITMASHIFAQSADKCDNTETIETCFARIANAVDATVTKAKDDLAKANTGVPTLTSALASAKTDFLSMFLASADSSIITRGNDGSLTLDLNIGSKKFVTGRPLKVQAVLHAPALDPKVKAGLSGDTLLTAEKSLDELDDISLSVSYSPQNMTLGRTLEPHRALYETLIGPPPTDLSSAQRLLNVLADAQTKFGGAQAPPFGQMGAHRVAIEAATIAAAREQITLDLADIETRKQRDIDTFVTLLDQQPQFYASVIQRSRNNLIGGDSLSFKVTYETSGRSLRNFYPTATTRGCGETQLLAAREGETNDACLEAWKAFVAEEKTVAATSTSGRFAFSVEYAGVDANKVEVALPVPAAPFKLETGDTESLIGSIKYSYTLQKDDAGLRKSGFDVNVSYENVTGNQDKDNRFIASAVYSTKLSKDMTLPIGIVYANHEKDPAFKDTDRKLSVHFGLVFKLPSLTSLTGK